RGRGCGGGGIRGMESMLMLLALAVLALPVLLVVVLVALGNLKRRVGELEGELGRLRAGEWTELAAQRASARRGAAAGAPAAAARPAEPPLPGSTPAHADAARSTAEPAAVAASRPPAAPARAVPPPPPPRIEPVPGTARPVPGSPPALDRLATMARRWFTEGNVPVKVGMLVLLAGVAALLKYASDQGWLTLPIGMRLAAIALAALAALAFAWRKRESHRSFALAVQGGAIGVLLLVVFAAFKLHGMLPAGAAFALSVGLVTALGVLAVLQGSRKMAVLGILAGFLAPIWLSTGSGNHVVLFSYY